MDELLGRAWWMLILRGTVALLFGILALFWPDLTLLLLLLSVGGSIERTLHRRWLRKSPEEQAAIMRHDE